MDSVTSHNLSAPACAIFEDRRVARRYIPITSLFP